MRPVDQIQGGLFDQNQRRPTHQTLDIERAGRSIQMEKIGSATRLQICFLSEAVDQQGFIRQGRNADVGPGRRFEPQNARRLLAPVEENLP